MVGGIGVGTGTGTVDRAVGGRALRTLVAVLPLKVLLQVLRQCSDITLAEYDAAFRKKGTAGTTAAAASAAAASTASAAGSSGASGSAKKGEAVIVATIGGAEAASNSKAAKVSAQYMFSQ